MNTKKDVLIIYECTCSNVICVIGESPYLYRILCNAYTVVLRVKESTPKNPLMETASSMV